MKKILFLFSLIIFISCSNDDDFSSPENQEVENPENPNPENPTIDLSQNFGDEVSREKQAGRLWECLFDLCYGIPD